jgi:hypothetical protein
MNDDELTTMVCESFTGVHTTTPVEQIVSRGRTARARRRIPGLAGALAVAAAAALAVSSLLPGTHQAASPQPAAQLAAWTVTKQADGTIRVTIRELRNPAGLQSELRADGVPASVTLIGQENPSCRRYPASPGLLQKVITRTFEVLPTPHQGPPASMPDQALSLVVVTLIHPSALPSGTGVQLATTFTLLPPVVANGGVENVAHGDVEQGLVYASAQCTG